MRIASLFLYGSLIALASAPARAGDKVLEGSIPAWVSEVDLSTLDLKKDPSELVADSQYRLEGGTVVSYTDSVVRIDNADSLMDENTLSLSWMPDKGDLTVHRLEILRDGEVVDVLGQGAKFDVIRREQGLEYRLLDGELTATMSIPGLRVGDILRKTYSVSVRDQALGDEMQALQYLGSAPWRVGVGRVIASWPEGTDIHWKAEDAVKLEEPELRDGYRYLTVQLPLPESRDVPRDAPFRFQRDNILRIGSFADWAELSRVMAPHFAEAAKVADASGVAKQAAAIMKQTSDPLERAQLATRLVQDKVSYLLNGLDGGNYLPQDAEFTWDKRYGDCKAKSTLLFALLQRMGISAEPALVVSRGGDALPELLPVAGDFDHVIVHATIDGKDYWLDGTSTGTRMYNIADVPNFSYALPLRAEGANLMPMAQRDKTFPDMAITGTLDHSAGIDLPQLFTLAIEVSGAAGAGAEAMADADDPDLLRRMAGSFARTGGMNGGVLSSIKLTYDKESAMARVVLSGLALSSFTWKDGKFTMRDEMNGQNFLFNPDRARREWRDIPVATAGPSLVRNDIDLILPEGGKGFSMTSAGDLEGQFANTRISTKTSLVGDKVETTVLVWQTPGEVAASDVAAAKREALKLSAAIPRLNPPGDAVGRWDLDEKQRRAKAAQIVKVYDAAIAFSRDDDNAALIGKADFLSDMYLYDEALKAYDAVIEKVPTARIYNARAAVHLALGKRDLAIADLRESYDLEPANETAFSLAQQLAYAGSAEEGLAMLEELPVQDDEKATYSDAWATVSGLMGDKDAALALLAGEVASKPENSDLLNAECWFRGLFDVQADGAVPGCTRAIERADNPAAALDSRAMVEFRLGKYDEAIADLDAVLKLSPWIANSRYMRGIVRLRRGDKGGAEDIAKALAMAPNLSEYYGRHGILPHD